MAIRKRHDLLPGALIQGPAVTVKNEISTVVTVSLEAQVDDFGYIELTRRSEALPHQIT